jgi:hypothetical protein
VSKIVQSASSQALCRIGRFRAPRLRFQIGASPLRHFCGDPDDEQAHQVSVLIGYPNPAFVGLSHPLWQQRIQLQRLALWGEVTWFWLEHGSACNCQPLVEPQCSPSPDSLDPR